MLRLLFLGSSEFEGDEARAMLLALGAVHGQDALPLLHKKGPVEILIPLGTMALTGQTNELVTRLPLAIASLVALLGVYLLAQQMLRSLTHNAAMAGLVAAAVLAVDGFLVAYGRILQYQSIVVLMMLGAVWCCWRFVENEQARSARVTAKSAQSTAGFQTRATRQPSDTAVQTRATKQQRNNEGKWSFWQSLVQRFLPKPRYRHDDMVSRTTDSAVLLTGAAVFASVGVLSHYDYGFVLPMLIVLVGVGIRTARGTTRQWVGILWLPVLVGGSIAMSFYLPFMLHENFRGTVAYLGQRAGEGGSTFYNNLPGYYRIVTFYNTTYAIATLGSILVIALGVWLVRYVHPRSMGWSLATMLAVGCGILLWQPAWFVLTLGTTSVNVALVVFGVPLVALVLSSATPLPLRVLLVWFAFPFCAESFLIADPRTHFYSMHIAAALLIGLAIAQFVPWLTRQHRYMNRVVLVPLTLVGSVLFALAWGYNALVFVRQMPEYKRMFPAARPAIYRASYGDTLPNGGHYGHPHRDGWKVIGELYRQGVFVGEYYSNQMERISAWYTRGAFRCSQQPRYYFIGTWAASESDMAIPIHTIRQTYTYAGCVLVDNTNMLDVYSRAPNTLPDQTHKPTVYQLNDYIQPFDAVPLEPFPIQQPLQLAVPQHRLEQQWQGGLTLIGYDLNATQFAAGQHTIITGTVMLNWQVTTPVAVGYTLVVEVRDGNGDSMAQGQPLCNTPPPDTWHTAHRGAVMTPFQFQVTVDTDRYQQRGYTLSVGLYNATTGVWLPLANGEEWAMLTMPAAHGKEQRIPSSP